MLRMYGVYYRQSIHQLWQFYVGCDERSIAIQDAEKFIAAHPINDVMIATYPAGWPENWHRICWQHNGADHSKDTIGEVGGIINSLQADYF